MEPLEAGGRIHDRADGLARARGGVKRDFSKARRLLNASDFNRVFKQGRRQSVPEFTLAFRVRSVGKDGRVFPPRLGLSVSRKVGKSVQRNLLKRRVREIFRLNHEKLPFGIELVLIPRKEVLGLSYQALEKKIFSLLERSKMLKKDQ
jgi:ribonuclease P protein component